MCNSLCICQFYILFLLMRNHTICKYDKENGSRPDETAGNVESEQSNFKGTCYVLS